MLPYCVTVIIIFCDIQDKEMYHNLVMAYLAVCILFLLGTYRINPSPRLCYITTCDRVCTTRWWNETNIIKITRCIEQAWNKSTRQADESRQAWQGAGAIYYSYCRRRWAFLSFLPLSVLVIISREGSEPMMPVSHAGFIHLMPLWHQRDDTTEAAVMLEI